MIPEVTAHRRFLHQIPELDNNLPQTLALVTGVLRGHRCEYFSPIQGGVCVWFDFGRPETVAFRADMDALPVQEATGVSYASRHPGQMHACGHDGHTAMALSLAQWVAGVAASGEAREIFPRNILILFQPSEETASGADALCRTGILERYQVSRIFGLHIWPGVPEGVIASRPGALMARYNKIDIKIAGESVHISRAEEGHDALLAAMEFLRRAQIMADNAPPPCVLRFGVMRSGTARNIISGETVLQGGMRTYQEETYQYCREALIRLSGEIARETGCPVSVSLSDSCGAVWNHEELYHHILNGLGPDAICQLEKPVLASEDFSFYQERVPGVFFFLGAGDTAELHSSAFNFHDEIILPKGVEFLKRLATLE